MTSADPLVRDGGSRAWVDWENDHVSLASDALRRTRVGTTMTFGHCFATLVTHYWARGRLSGPADPAAEPTADRHFGPPHPRPSRRQRTFGHRVSVQQQLGG